MGKNKMKSKFLSIFVIMIVFSSMVLSKSKNKPDPKKYKNIHDILKNYPAAKDNRDLWKNMPSGGYNSVEYGGVHDPHDYKPPQAGSTPGPYKISSPSPKRKPLKGERVIAADLAGPSTSKSVFDLPDRKNVQQIDLPVSTTKKISYHYNSQRAIKKPNLKLQFHGTRSVQKKTFHGKFLEMSSEISPARKKKILKAMEKKAKKKKAKAKAKDEALKIAKQVETKTGPTAKKVKITPNKLIIPIISAMKRENNNLQHKHKKV